MRRSRSLGAEPEEVTGHPGEGGAEGRAVYSTLVLGENAYGVTELQGGEFEISVDGDLFKSIIIFDIAE